MVIVVLWQLFAHIALSAKGVIIQERGFLLG